MIKRLRRWWYSMVPTYRTVEGRLTSYHEADNLIRSTVHMDDPNQWDIWPEQEDRNRQIGLVYIRRRQRIYE